MKVLVVFSYVFVGAFAITAPFYFEQERNAPTAITNSANIGNSKLGLQSNSKLGFKNEASKLNSINSREAKSLGTDGKSTFGLKIAKPKTQILATPIYEEPQEPYHDYSVNEIHALAFEHVLGMPRKRTRRSIDNIQHHSPVMSRNGVPLETPEVQLARTQHMIAHYEARRLKEQGPHNQIQTIHPIAFKSHQNPHEHIPVIGPNGVPIDTPEVQLARAEHLAAHAKAKQHKAGERHTKTPIETVLQHQHDIHQQHQPEEEVYEHPQYQEVHEDERANYVYPEQYSHYQREDEEEVNHHPEHYRGEYEQIHLNEY